MPGEQFLLNQAGDNFDPSCWDPIVKALYIKYDSVIIAELKDEKIFQASEQISGIILAAGGSDRFGTPKQLAEWNGKPLIRWVAEAAVNSRLSEGDRSHRGCRFGSSEAT